MIRNFIKPIMPQIKQVGYYNVIPHNDLPKGVSEGKHYVIWHYYKWSGKFWKLISHNEWLIIANLTPHPSGTAAWITEEHQLISAT